MYIAATPYNTGCTCDIRLAEHPDPLLRPALRGGAAPSVVAPPVALAPPPVVARASSARASFGVPHGVLYEGDVPDGFLDGWQCHYDEPYDHPTRDDTIRTIPDGASHVFVGAQLVESGAIVIGAVAELAVVKQVTDHLHRL